MSKPSITKGGLSQKEADYIKGVLQPDYIVMEWGMGSSTVHFCELVKEYHAIEHDKGWYGRVKNMVGSQGNAFLYHVPNNAPRTQPTKREEFRDYVEHINNFPKDYFDVYFIDGRARVYCAIEGYDQLKTGGLVLIHDYDRTHYHGAEDYYKKIDQVGKLGVLEK